MPKHIEHPAFRHSAPASINTLSKPSDSACKRTRAEPGTTSIRRDDEIFFPLRISAAERRSSIRPLVQDPKKTVSITIFFSGVPAVRPIYVSARSAAPRSSASAISAGFGTDEFLKIIRYVIKDANIFVISHKTGLEDKFESVTKFDKRNGFSYKVES